MDVRGKAPKLEVHEEIAPGLMLRNGETQETNGLKGVVRPQKDGTRATSSDRKRIEPSQGGSPTVREGTLGTLTHRS